MRFHLLFGFIIVAALSGCAATPGLYQWGSYDAHLYSAYKDPAKTENLRIKLETHIAEMERGGIKVAPGLYAELGTVYLQSGMNDKARHFYIKERDTWPESRGLMTALVQNLDRRSQVKPAQSVTHSEIKASGEKK